MDDAFNNNNELIIMWTANSDLESGMLLMLQHLSKVLALVQVNGILDQIIASLISGIRQ